MIFEVECDKRRTYGPDAHTYCLFYKYRYTLRFIVCEDSCRRSCHHVIRHVKTHPSVKNNSMRKRKKRRKKGKFIYFCFHCQHSIMSKSGCVLIDCPWQKAAIRSAAWPLPPRDGAGSCAGRHPARSVCIARPCSYRPEDTRHSALKLQTIFREVWGFIITEDAPKHLLVFSHWRNY